MKVVKIYMKMKKKSREQQVTHKQTNKRRKRKRSVFISFIDSFIQAAAGYTRCSHSRFRRRSSCDFVTPGESGGTAALTCDDALDGFNLFSSEASKSKA